MIVLKICRNYHWLRFLLFDRLYKRCFFWHSLQFVTFLSCESFYFSTDAHLKWTRLTSVTWRVNSAHMYDFHFPFISGDIKSGKFKYS
jgi:hypothetical protein